MTASEHVYCTYFDHRYLFRGLAMTNSLRRVGDHGRMWVHCLSDKAPEALSRQSAPAVIPIAVSDVEQTQPRRVAVRGRRSTMEYFFTPKPWFAQACARRRWRPPDWLGVNGCWASLPAVASATVAR